MDPRPFHFDYRKPRVGNPTYLSFHTRDSIYQLNNSIDLHNIPKRDNPERHYNVRARDKSGSQEGSTPQSQPITYGIMQPPKQRNSSSDIKSSDKIEINRYHSKNQLDRSTQKTPSNLSAYGAGSLNLTYMDQSAVYRKQQKAFNIINFGSTQGSQILKKYPKLTLEDQLRDRKALYQRNRLYKPSQ